MWRRWTGIEPAVVGSPRPPALKAGEPTRYPDTSGAEDSWSALVNRARHVVDNARSLRRPRENPASLDNTPRHETTLRGRNEHDSAVERGLEGEVRCAADDAVVRHERHREVNRNGQPSTNGTWAGSSHLELRPTGRAQRCTQITHVSSILRYPVVPATGTMWQWMLGAASGCSRHEASRSRDDRLTAMLELR